MTPDNLLVTELILDTALLSILLCVEPDLTIRTSLSIESEIIRGSVTAEIGGESNKIKSNWSLSESISFSICFEPSSSDGFGGIIPDGMTCKFSTSVL